MIRLGYGCCLYARPLKRKKKGDAELWFNRRLSLLYTYVYKLGRRLNKRQRGMLLDIILGSLIGFVIELVILYLLRDKLLSPKEC